MSSNTYFSNHSSQSRFLAISASSSTSSTSSSLSNTAPAPPTRTRSTSKHFSTSVSVSTSSGTDPQVEETGIPTPRVHPLRTTWVFYFRQHRAPGNKIVSYEEGIKRVSAFSSVESFWALQTHLTPPSALLPTTDYLLFHARVQRPVWEDPGVADRIWEALVCAVVGEAFAGCRGEAEREAEAAGEAPKESADTEDGEEFPEICGCTISVRQSEDIISLWNRVDQDVRVRERIRDTLRQVLGLPPSTVMEYKSNNDSMQDKSSFRNSAVER
ncbi:Eukaryotic translation initiation factor 4e member 2 [Mycena sanguinolenta]|uniref:Eukaryotic translation initiation factor 4e member 2 n=1 Tax=Mycena sanguinolenta TaxID=230812 RepID=A0A8H6Z5I7_9AGAR|nr:Eukaryotic translation initiation factor 4e member 2 [Mycena sanguinolenta]